MTDRALVERRSMVEQYLRRSAELLREEAECLRDSHAVSWPDGEVKWDDTDECDRQAQATHDEMLALAIQLDLMATEPPADRKAETVAPYPNCRFRFCDLPGQCIHEGKCHHPRKVDADLKAVMLECAQIAFDQKSDAPGPEDGTIAPNTLPPLSGPAPSRRSIQVDMPATLSRDSLNRRSMPGSENIQRSVAVTIMNHTALAARPLSYSQTCDTFRPRIGLCAATRTGLGAAPLVYFRKRRAMPNGLVREHISEGRPTGIKHGLRHFGLGEFRGVHVAHRDVVKAPHDAERGFVVEVSTRIADAGVDISCLSLFARSLGQGKRSCQSSQMTRILNFLAGRKRGEVLQPQIDAYSPFQGASLRALSLNDHVEKPVAASVTRKVSAILYLGVSGQVSTLENTKLSPVEAEAFGGLLNHSSFERHPRERLTPAIAQIRSALLRSGSCVILADLANRVGAQTKLCAATRREINQVETRKPLAIPLESITLPIIAEVPDEIDRASLPVQLAHQRFNAIAIGDYHNVILRAYRRK